MLESLLPIDYTARPVLALIPAGLMAILYVVLLRRESWTAARQLILTTCMLWILYTAYECGISNSTHGVNIRVDLVVFMPILNFLLIASLVVFLCSFFVKRVANPDDADS